MDPTLVSTVISWFIYLLLLLSVRWIKKREALIYLWLSPYPKTKTTVKWFIKFLDKVSKLPIIDFLKDLINLVLHLVM